MPGFWRVRVIGGAILAALAIGGCEAPKTKPPAVSVEAASREAEYQKEFVLRNRLQEWSRLWAIGMPLLEAGAGLCGSELTPFLGFDFASIHSFERTYRAAAARVLRVDDFARVTSVYRNSPADRAGFQVGDALLAIGARTVPPGPEATTRVSSLFETEVVAGRPTTFMVRRGPDTVNLTVVPTQRCHYNLRLADDEIVNAYADGRNVVITRGMMRLAGSDQHVAVIIGHEVAHNAMGHITAKRKNALVGGLGGLLADVAAAALGVNTGGAFTDAGIKAGAASYSIAFEQEADYVGMYMLARAGYPLDGAAEIWRLLATKDPNLIVFARTHPTSPERYLGFEKYIGEINRKLAAAMPLVPEGVRETVPAPQYARAQPPRLNVQQAIRLVVPAPVEPRQPVLAAPAQPPRPEVQQAQRRESLAAAEAKLPPARPVTPMPATTRWVGGGPEDACGEPWFMHITVTSGTATGQLVRSGVGYDVTGEVGAAGELRLGRASKNKASIGLEGPFALQIDVAFGPERAVGNYAIEDNAQAPCRTPFALHRLAG